MDEAEFRRGVPGKEQRGGELGRGYGRGEWRKCGHQGRRGRTGRRHETGGEARNGTGTWGRRE